MEVAISSQRFAADRLEGAIRDAKRLGFCVRRQWLDGECGGWCEVGGLKLLVLDISLPLSDQIDLVTRAMTEAAAPRSS